VISEKCLEKERKSKKRPRGGERKKKGEGLKNVH
jgi:hypothetical protein